MTTVAPTHPVLETQRLHLRPLLPSDADPLHEMFSDPQVTRYLDIPSSRSTEDTFQRLQLYTLVLPEWQAGWAVVEKQSEAIAGMVNYHHREIWNGRLEIGFVLARRYWRQGLMREAVRAVLDYCFAALAVHRVEATISPDNDAAIRLLESLGFRCESGRLRGRIKVGGTYRDLVMYGLLDEDRVAVGPDTSPDIGDGRSATAVELAAPGWVAGN